MSLPATPQLWRFAPLRAESASCLEWQRGEQSGVVKKHPFQGRTAPRQLSERQLASDASCAVTCWRAMPFP